MKKTAPLSLRLAPEMKDRLQKLADADRRSLTNYVELIILDHLKKQGTRKPSEKPLAKRSAEIVSEPASFADDFVELERVPDYEHVEYGKRR